MKLYNANRIIRIFYVTSKKGNLKGVNFMNALAYTMIKNDIRFYRRINQMSASRVLYHFMKLATMLGSTSFSVTLSIFLLFTENNIGVLLVSNLIVSQLFIQTIKRIVHRPRPYKILQGAIAINPPKCRYSFPSGHSSSSLVIALVLASCFPVFSFLFISLALLVGISRILLGFHYPSDVLSGFLISFVIFIVLH
jgi:undecaprenyl-diphosphatase